MASEQASTLLRSNGVKIITVFIGDEYSTGYEEQRAVVTDVGELGGLRVDQVDFLLQQNETDLLLRATDIPPLITGLCLSQRHSVYNS